VKRIETPLTVGGENGLWSNSGVLILIIIVGLMVAALAEAQTCTTAAVGGGVITTCEPHDLHVVAGGGGA
jgi:hypothetical protein